MSEGDGGRMGDGTRRARVTDIEAWRIAIRYAPKPELGMVDWPRVLGWVLDELGDTRARLAAVRVLERWFEDRALYAEEVGGRAANVADVWRTAQSALTAALGGTDQAGDQHA